MNIVMQNAETRMRKAIEALKTDLAKLRTGRAHVGLLDHLMVSYYGNDTPIAQVASITVSDARTLMVTPWEKNMLSAVEKAIRSSDLGLNPAATGNALRIPLPALTEDRRREMVKLVKQEGEGAKVSVRNIRRDANDEFKKKLKEKVISEDEERRAQDLIQKLTDKFVAEIEQLLAVKEKELMEI